MDESWGLDKILIMSEPATLLFFGLGGLLLRMRK